MQRAFPLGLVVLAVTSAAHAQTPATPEARTHAIHVLDRLTFGPRNGDVDRVLAIGIDRWIEQQLNPDVREDLLPPTVPPCDMWNAHITAVPTITQSVETVGQNGAMFRASFGLVGGFILERPPNDDAFIRGVYDVDRRIVACRIMRAEQSEYQLLEVMTDFWSNHFSIFSAALPSRNSLALYDRARIRPNALGRFRDLLGAVAHDPAMLAYLNNDVSGPADSERSLAEYAEKLPAGTVPHNGLNENFGRELLELHTLGADGGYTQADVIAAARVFSGWTHSGLKYGCADRTLPSPDMSCRDRIRSAPAFRFDSTKHDAGAKVILGRTLPAGRGVEEGEEVLDMLAKHPATARFIARKLAVRFVSDAPPQSIIDRAAETFERTDGDIRAVMRTIIASDEFRSAQGAKIKSPLEYVVSVRRALDAQFDDNGDVVESLMDMDQPPYGHRTPEGWPETAAPWLTSSAVLARINYAHAVAHDSVPSIRVTAWPAWEHLKTLPHSQQVDGVITKLLHGRASPQLRAALLAAAPRTDEADLPAAREQSLRTLLALVLGSPDFQRR